MSAVILSAECRVSKSASYGRLPSLQGRGSPRGGGMSRRSKSPSSTSSGTCVSWKNNSVTLSLFLEKRIVTLVIAAYTHNILALQLQAYMHATLDSNYKFITSGTCNAISLLSKLNLRIKCIKPSRIPPHFSQKQFDSLTGIIVHNLPPHPATAPVLLSNKLYPQPMALQAVSCPHLALESLPVHLPPVQPAWEDGG